MTLLSTNQLKTVLEQSLSAEQQTRKQAEKQLDAAKTVSGNLLVLLEIVASNDPSVAHVRQVAAVLFKNYVKNGWDTSDDNSSGIVISPQDRTTIKTHLVQLMCTVPPIIQAQCSESISLIAKLDFPDNWQNLLPELVQKFNSPDPAVTNGVLLTANSIFKRFRYVQRSDELYREIIYSLKHVQEPILTLFKSTSQAVVAFEKDAAQLVPRFETLRLIVRIFFSLNYQDLPEYFEDHMGEWMEGFSTFLQYKNVLLTDDSEETEPSPLDRLQAGIVENLKLYAGKDEEPFLPFLPKFTQLVWNLLLHVTAHPKHDILATSCIRFLGSLVKKLMHKDLFKEDATLRQIIGNIVVPNLMIREVDEIRFDEDPDEFIATDIEGSETESRRRCSQDLLRDMCRQFEAEATAICSEHVGTMLSEFAANPSSKWQAKDVAIHLMFGIAIKAQSTHGVSQVNPAVDVMSFFASNILPELQEKASNRPMLTATSLKFVATFRNQFSTEQLSGLMPSIIQHLASPIVVVHTYAAFTIEKILTVTEPTPNGRAGKCKFGRNELNPFLEGLFTSLFQIVDNIDLNDNAYVMKCLMRSLSVVGEGIVPVTQAVLDKLTAALARVAKKPWNPQYNHYMFESIAILIKSVCKAEPTATSSFEALLFSPFEMVLSADVSEFTPYVFQILAQLLEFRPKQSGLGDSYTGLFGPLLTPVVWDRKGNIPALTRLMRAYLGQAGAELTAAGHLVPILGVFQKLVSSRANEQSGFDLLGALVVYIEPAALQPYVKQVFQILLKRLQIGKTPRYVRLVTQFFALFVGKYGAQSFIDQLNAIQPGLALTVVVQVWNPRLQSDPPTMLNAKVQVVGLTKLLCESSGLLAHQDGKKIWAQTFASVVALLTSTSLSQPDEAEDEVPMEIEISYDASYSSLHFARRPAEDPFAEVTNPSTAFATALRELSASHPGQIPPIIDQSLQTNPKLGDWLQKMLQQAGVTLV